jgi:hypothetical protein
MSNDRTRDEKVLKKDQAGPREVRQEVSEEIRSTGSQPLVRQPNRDRARGDWDRTGSHQDADTSRSPAEEGDEFDERS